MKMIKYKNSRFFQIVFLIIVLMISSWIFCSFSYADASIHDVEENDLIPISNDPLTQMLQSAIQNEAITSYEYLYNLDGSPDYLCITYPVGGYAIFVKDTLEMLESSPYGASPYSNLTGDKYYAGPTNYFLKNNNTKGVGQFLNILTGNITSISNSDAKNYAQQTRQLFSNYSYDINQVLISNSNETTRSNTSSVPGIYDYDYIIPDSASGTWIPNRHYFEVNPTHGDNTGTVGNENGGTCLVVASQILLAYHNYFNDRRIVENTMLNGYNDVSETFTQPEKNPNLCTDPMEMTADTTGTRSSKTSENSFYRMLVLRFMEPGQYGMAFVDAEPKIEDYLSTRLPSNAYTVNSNFGTTADHNAIIAEINAGRPVFIGMSESLSGAGHAVVGYGYQNYTYPTGEGTYLGYVVHAGEIDMNCIWINSAWCNGYLSMQVSHEHNYTTVGPIGYNYNRIESKCTICGHRTDSVTHITEDEGFVERTLSLPQNGMRYKEFQLSFTTSGNRIVQSVRNKSGLRMYLYDTNYNLLAYSNEGGANGPFINYGFVANQSYILKLELGTHVTDDTFSITYAYSMINAMNYEQLTSYDADDTMESIDLESGRVFLVTFTANSTGYHTFECWGAEGEGVPKIYLLDPYGGSTTVEGTYDPLTGKTTCLKKLYRTFVYTVVICFDDVVAQDDSTIYLRITEG